MDADRIAKIIEVRKIMQDREKARKGVDFAKSDHFRERLEEMGVEVKDQKGGPSGWRFKDGSAKKLPAGTAVPDSARKRSNEEADAPTSKKSKTSSTTSTDTRPAAASAKTTAPAALNKKPKVVSAESLRNSELLKAVAPPASSTTQNIEGVIIEEVKTGTGPKAKNGDRIKMNYVGRLKTTNKVFDSSAKKPFVFRLGRGEVIRGWDIGCAGMQVGTKRVLTIPPTKGYGKGGAPPTIPGNATLVFDVSLLEIM